MKSSRLPPRNPSVTKRAFWEAVKKHRTKEVAAALELRPDFAASVESSGRTPLHLCARQPVSSAAEARASIATASVLIKAGADPHAVHSIPDDGEIFPASVLWYALAFGRNRPLGVYLVKKLKVDPNHCLFALVWADDLVSAKLLRRHGANLDEVGHGETPLIYAIRHTRVKFAEWLLREGADPTIRDSRGFTALHHAVRKRLPGSTIRLLLQSGAKTDSAVAPLATRAQQKLLGLA